MLFFLLVAVGQLVPVHAALPALQDAKYTFSDRGELRSEEIDGSTFASIQDPNQSGATTGKQNQTRFTLAGSMHPEATAEIYAGSNLVHSTSQSPFSYSFNESNLPGLQPQQAAYLLEWSVVATRPGSQFEGGAAVSKLAGSHVFAPANETIIYDAASRREQDALHTYSWNAADHLLETRQRHHSYRIEHIYDSQQRRICKRIYKNQTLFTIHRFVYDGWLPVVEEVQDAGGNLRYTNSYIWGPSPHGTRNPGLGATGQLALLIHKPRTGAHQFSAPIYNHRLDIVGLVDVETGDVVAEYAYSPFGKQLKATGPRAHHCPFRFAGAYYDSETGTNYFGYRHYDPRTKQWLNRDPIGESGGLNLYAYANNDPINGKRGLPVHCFIFSCSMNQL